MNKKARARSDLHRVALGLLAFCSLGAGTAGAQENALPTFNAADVLPGAVLSGPAFNVHPIVRNDGFLNHFTVTVDGQDYFVAGNALMRERLREISVLPTMDAIRGTDTYKNAAKKGVEGTLKTAKNLVVEPVDTVTGIAKGAQSFFKGLGHSIFGGASEQEEGTLKVALGFDVAKRRFAGKFGVDPYTTFPPVKERLDDFAWAGVGGSLTVSAAFSAIPDGAGTAVSGLKAGGGMSGLLLDKSPAELKEYNAKRLRQMKVSEGAIDLFVEHPSISPADETLIVDALALVGAYDREHFVRRAILVQQADMAFFMRRWAQMIQAYHVHVAPVQRFVRLGRMPVTQREDGVIVALLPVDHLVWTDEIIGLYETNMQDIGKIPGISGGEMWIEGTISEKARAALESHNWVVREKVGPELGAK